MIDLQRSDWTETASSDRVGAQFAWVAARELLPFACGSRFGPGARYHLLQVLAASERGCVYRATDLHMSEQAHEASVVVKLRRVAEGRREALRHRRISSDAVAKVYDCGIFENWHYTVSEYVDGQPLDEIEAPIKPRRAVAIAIQIASGLQAVHDVRLIHADIKPQNILISADDRVKIIDFDLSSELETLEDLGGNRAFLAPERFESSEMLGNSADIYALGGVLYWMLTGKAPNGSDPELVAGCARGEIPREGEVKIAPLRRIIEKALHPDPQSRYASAGAFAEALLAWQRSMPPPGVRTPAGARAMLLARRRPAIVASALFLGVCAVGAAAHGLHVERLGIRHEVERQAAITDELEELRNRAAEVIGIAVEQPGSFMVMPMYAWLDILVDDKLFGPDARMVRGDIKRASLRAIIRNNPEGSFNHDLASFTLAYMIAANRFAEPGAFEEFDALLAGVEQRWKGAYGDSDPIIVGIAVAKFCREAYDPQTTDDRRRAMRIELPRLLRSIPDSAEQPTYLQTLRKVSEQLRADR